MVGSGPDVPGRDSWSIEIEVKARTRTFTTPESFPFPTIIIEPSSRFCKRETHPDWYCMVSQENYAMLFLKSKEEYSVEEKKGREYITAPKEEWLSLDQFLEELPEASLTPPG